LVHFITFSFLNLGLLGKLLKYLPHFGLLFCPDLWPHILAHPIAVGIGPKRKSGQSGEKKLTKTGRELASFAKGTSTEVVKVLDLR